MPVIGQSRIMILATHGFEQSELEVPLKQLAQAGAAVEVVSPEAGEIRGWKGKDWGTPVKVDRDFAEARIEDYDALVLPGGQINPDLLRVDDEVVRFIRAFHRSGKPLAAICHAPWLLIEAELVDGRRATSYRSMRTDMVNAGARWEDSETVRDGNMITARNPGDLDAFVAAIIEAVEGRDGQLAAAE